MAPGTVRGRLLDAERGLNQLFPEREDFIRGLLLGMITRNHVCCIGPPGTAKTSIVKVLFSHISDGTLVEELCTPGMKEDALYGPIKIKDMREKGRYERNIATPPRLPVADVVLLDEIWKTNPAILHTFLGPLSQDRQFNNPEPMKIPLRCAIGLSNELPPEDCHLEALWSRFLLRYEVTKLRGRDNLQKILFGGSDAKDEIPELSIKDFEVAEEICRGVVMSQASVNTFFSINTRIELQEISVHDRRLFLALASHDVQGNKAASLVKAQAWLSGRSEVHPQDLSILNHVLWEHPKDCLEIRPIVDKYAIPESAKIVQDFDRLADSIKAITQGRNKKGSIKEEEYQSVSDSVDAALTRAKQFITASGVADEESSYVAKHAQRMVNVRRKFSTLFEAQKRNVKDF